MKGQDVSIDCDQNLLHDDVLLKKIFNRLKQLEESSDLLILCQ